MRSQVRITSLNRLTPKQLAKYNDSLEALRLMRSGLSFSKSVKMAGTSPHMAKKYLSAALKRENHKISAKRTDSLTRILRIYEDGEENFIQVMGLAKAQKIAKYHSAIGQGIDRANPCPLKEFQYAVVKDIFGKYHHFETDISKLLEIFEKREEPEFFTIYRRQ
ncbi:MAG: hypothetical protein KC444_10285 [Nitrosopumilus sp.]|nr:hypothetical protein [Nitrosopumilus sp.]